MNVPDLDEVLWQAWKAMELPEGYRAEIIEGAIEVSPTGRFSHAQVVNRLRDALAIFLQDSEYGAWNDTNVIHARRAWIPDGLVAPRDAELIEAEDGLGIKASAVHVIVEVVSPGGRNQERDRVKKRREYARAAVPVYVIIDDYDSHGTVTVLTEPEPDKADWVGVHRVPYGTEVTISEGPAKGFVIDEAITGPKRS
ncbi:Uma2 family endonuclease [Streptomyces sp. TRM70350]|uniref:Uma2 family endonuclease n=1 Tax=Streptomyces sp. TRM70350 TaxID=2856165 RepID=UPI001C463357|nr:Uma2 family endonuclease [Streptomyces sp. TRM70350]MBV7696852.1 Uma2 family endonuclease [Streptomyces sp. TRM70350]